MEVFFAPYGGPRTRRYFFAFEGGHGERDGMVNALHGAMGLGVFRRLQDRVGMAGSLIAGAQSDNPINFGSSAIGPAIYGSTAGGVAVSPYVQLPQPIPAGVTSGASLGFAYNYAHNLKGVLEVLTEAWRERRLTNYDYLMALNTLAGRSFNDLTQYPVLPWVLCDYVSAPGVDLSSPASFRDLSRPMGAMTSERLKEFRARYETFDDDTIPKFLYGSHYSTAVGTVVHYNIRLYPFTRIHLAVQEGHYDVADRLFTSVPDAWAMNTHSLSEVKELTPEFYTQPHFLVNASRYNFGSLQDRTRVDSVKLPPWARSPHHFVATMRQAMESETASAQLHAWIDLIFGYKQRGPASVAADNVFYYLTYAGGIDIDAIEEPAFRKAMQMQITHYGQTPLQILRKPHAARGPHPVAPPVSVPPSPFSACNDALATGSMLPAPGSGAGNRRASMGPGAMARRSGAIGGILRVVDTVAANVRAVGAVAAGAVNSVRSAVAGSGNSLRVARPLAVDLRMFASVTGALPLDNALAARQRPLLSPPNQSSILARTASLPFSLVRSSAFTHVCSLPESGCSLWRLDTPNDLPLGVQMLCGALPPTAPSPPAGSGDSSGSNVYLSFGDVMVLGASPPPASLMLKVPRHALRDVVDVRGASGEEWPRAFPDPYTTSPEMGYRRPGAAKAGASPSSPPFALPLKFQLVCEVNGTASVPEANAGVGTEITLVTLSVAEDEAEPWKPVLSDSRFHVWWPIAPAGYASLGAIVTAATVSRHLRGVDNTRLDELNRPARVYEYRVKPTVPAIDACVCVHVACLTPALLTTFVPVPHLALNIPPKPREEQVVFRQWGKGSRTQGPGHAPRASTALPSGAAGAILSEDGAVLRGWKDKQPAGTPAAGSADGATPAGSGGLAASATTTPATGTTHTPAASTSASGADTLGPLFSFDEAPPRPIVAPEDEWVIPDTQTSSGADGKGSSGMPPSSARSATASGTPSSSSSVFSYTAEDEALQEAAAIGSAGATAGGSDDSDRKDAAATAAGIASTLTSRTMLSGEPAKVARIRAHRSKAMAMYAVNNRVASFVIPAPVSVQRLSTVLDRLRRHQASAGTPSSTATAPSTASTSTGSLLRISEGATGGSSTGHAGRSSHADSDLEDLLALAYASASRSGSNTGTAGAASSSSDGPLPELVLASTPVPPVNEPCDATYHKAHALSAANAYDLHEVLLAKLETDAPAPASSFEVSTATGASLVSRPAPAFAAQHWTADSCLPAASSTASGPGSRAPSIVAIRVLASVNMASSLIGAAAAGAVSALLSVPPRTVVALDALGQLTRYKVTAAPSFAAADVQEFVDGVNGHIAAMLMGGLEPSPASSASFARSGASGGASSPAPASATFERHPFARAPHARIRIVPQPPQTGAPLVMVPCRGVIHSPAAPLPSPLRHVLPAALCDCRDGGLVVTSTGRGAGMAMAVVEVPPYADTAPQAATTGAAGADAARRRAEATTPSGPPHLVVSQSAAVPSITTGAVITAMGMDVDVLVVGYSDGCVQVRHVAGLSDDVPRCKARPETTFLSFTADPVRHIAVSRDDDFAVVVFETEAFLVELARGRVLQVISAPALAGDASATFTCAATVAAAGFAIVVVTNGGQSLLLFGNDSFAGTKAAPKACLPLARSHVTCLARMRGGGVGDCEGPGAVLAVGCMDGTVQLLDSRDLTVLVAWQSEHASAVQCVDISPDVGFIVAGYADGHVAAFALPAALVVVPTELDAHRDDSLVNTIVSGAVTLGTGVMTGLESAKGAAKSTKVVVGEASSALRGFFGGIFGKKA